MKTSLNHIGIAVDDLPGMKRLFELLGFGVAHAEAVPSQGVTAHFLPLPRVETSLELLEVTDPQGTVAKFIEKRGPGIHHLSFELAKGTLDSTTQALRDAGYRMIYDAARPGAHQMRVNFIHPSTAGGLLIEIMEPQS